mmetsp:Transcript_22694/g.47354  ORF Transcript_22694/g.47354 Transcript_22694/m.47354 type:complete len:93 (-) Transcript_22694:482-760(-)
MPLDCCFCALAVPACPAIPCCAIPCCAGGGGGAPACGIPCLPCLACALLHNNKQQGHDQHNKMNPNHHDDYNKYIPLDVQLELDQHKDEATS